MTIKSLVLCGDGINCEVETNEALKSVGFQSEIQHINQLISHPESLLNYDLLALPGGFSFGDEIQSGKIFSLKIQKFFNDEFKQFIKKGNLVIGICNGFQVLTQLNAFTDLSSEECHFALTENEQEEFLNRWVELNPSYQNGSPWLSDLQETIRFPIRHGEGNLIVHNKYRENLKSYTALTYRNNVNGSTERIAGLTNLEGNVFGLMPHPEAAMKKRLDPILNTTSDEWHWGYALFANAYNHLKGKKS